MNKTHIAELREFINSFCQQQKIGNIDLMNFDLESTVDLDLNIHDIDMDLFLSMFSDRFNVDLSKFSWKNYGYPEGSIIASILRFIFGYKKWVKKISYKIYKPKLKVRQLLDGIESGILV